MKKTMTVLGATLQTASILHGMEHDVCAKAQWVLDYVKTFPDFPLNGVTFQWYSPLLREPVVFKKVIDLFARRYRDSKIDVIVALDSRGFIFGSTLAYELELPLVLISKAGKLPGEVVKTQYDLHYGKDFFEIEKNILLPNQQVLIIDDVLATGGTIKAACQIVEQLGAKVYEAACLLEFKFLNGRSHVPCSVYSIALVEGN